jgi:hypothetical protein
MDEHRRSVIMSEPMSASSASAVATAARPPSAAAPAVPLVRSWGEAVTLALKLGGGAVALALGLWSVYSSGRADALALELRIVSIERTTVEHTRRLDRMERAADEVGRRLNEADRRWERLDARLDEILRRLDRLDVRMGGGGS